MLRTIRKHLTVAVHLALLFVGVAAYGLVLAIGGTPHGAVLWLHLLLLLLAGVAISAASSLITPTVEAWWDDRRLPR